MGQRRSVIVAVVVLALVASGCDLLGRVTIPYGESIIGPTNGASWDPAVSGDARFVAFESSATDLVPGDINGVVDLFVRDVVTGTTERVNLAEGGGASAGAATDAAISADGRFVAFQSEAADLVAGDTNGVSDIFVRDRTGATTERVSLTGAGNQSAGAATDAAISADGRFVVFESAAADLVAGDTNGVSDIFVRDRTSATTTRVSVTAAGAQATGASTAAAISPSGAWVAFASTAPNLVSGDSNAVADVFVAARSGGTVRRASAPDAVTKPFQQSNAASTRPKVADPIGGYAGSGDPLVTYESQASNLAGTDRNGTGADVFVTTYLFGSLARTVRISDGTDPGTRPDIGVVGAGPAFVVTFVRAGDVLAAEHDSPISTSGAVRIVSTPNSQQPADGPSGDPAVTADGRFVAFRTEAGNVASTFESSSLGDIMVGRARSTTVEVVEPARVGLLETRDLTVRGSGFAPTSTVVLAAGVTVNAVTYVSDTELVVNVTATSTTPGDPWRDLAVLNPGVQGTAFAAGLVTCVDCFEIAAVVEQPGPVDIEITSADVQIGTFPLSLPECVAGLCPRLPATVDADGNLTFGVSSIDLATIPIPVELFPGVETTVEVVPSFVAPSGRVIPATGEVDLELGLALKLRAPLLPSTCAVGPVRAGLAAGPGADPTSVGYDQLTGTATLAGGFTEELAITGCGLFTGTLNALFGLPQPIAENTIVLGIRLDPTLTGTAVP